MAKTLTEKLIVLSVRNQRANKERTFSPAELKELRLRTEEEIEDLADLLEEKKEIIWEIRNVCKHAGNANPCPICGDEE